MVKNAAILVVMGSQPRAGTTKTRLCPPFSPQQVYPPLSEALLLDTFDLAGDLAGVRLAAAFSPADALPYFEQVSPPETILLPVDGADIGVCLVQAFEAFFKAGFKKGIALNADGPSLPGTYLLQAFDLLEDYGVVLGPGEDGGYYLVGLQKPLRRALPGYRMEHTPCPAADPCPGGCPWSAHCPYPALV